MLSREEKGDTQYLRSNDWYVNYASKWCKDTMERFEQEHAEVLAKIHDAVIKGLDTGQEEAKILIPRWDIDDNTASFEMCLSRRGLEYEIDWDYDSYTVKIDLKKILWAAKERAVTGGGV